MPHPTRRSLSVMLIAALLAATVSLPAASAKVVEFRLRGRLLAAPATVRMTIVVEPHEANRKLHIEIDGDGMFSSSEIELDGASEKRFHEIQFRGVPAGHYNIAAAVLSADGIRGRANESVDVIE